MSAAATSTGANYVPKLPSQSHIAQNDADSRESIGLWWERPPSRKLPRERPAQEIVGWVPRKPARMPRNLISALDRWEFQWARERGCWPRAVILHTDEKGRRLIGAEFFVLIGQWKKESNEEIPDDQTLR
jgi:hypothetical protein